jgi:hypothetical protein
MFLMVSAVSTCTGLGVSVSVRLIKEPVTTISWSSGELLAVGACWANATPVTRADVAAKEAKVAPSIGRITDNEALGADAPDESCIFPSP